jgi:hypothetical protein
MPGNCVLVEGAGETGQGSGYRISDTLVLTAGHVVYDWSNFGRFPPNIDDNGINVVVDYRGYRAEFFRVISSFQGSWPLQRANPNRTVTMSEIEGHPDIARRDSVLIKQGSGGIGPGDDGLVVFLDSSDLARTNSSKFLGSLTAVVRSDRSGTGPARLFISLRGNI